MFTAGLQMSDRELALDASHYLGLHLIQRGWRNNGNAPENVTQREV